MKAKYTTSVMVPAGWRSVAILAEIEQISPKMAKVFRVLAIDGEAPVGWATRTGAKRQTYCASSIAQREFGKIKRLSAMEIIE